MGARRKGFILGALVAAGATVWNAPQSGKQTREQIRETVEGALFTVLDFPEKIAGARQSTPAAHAADVAVVVTPPAAEPLVISGIEPAADLVIGGIRPSELSR